MGYRVAPFSRVEVRTPRVGDMLPFKMINFWCDEGYPFEVPKMRTLRRNNHPRTGILHPDLGPFFSWNKKLILRLRVTLRPRLRLRLRLAHRSQESLRSLWEPKVEKTSSEASQKLRLKRKSLLPALAYSQPQLGWRYNVSSLYERPARNALRGIVSLLYFSKNWAPDELPK